MKFNRALLYALDGSLSEPAQFQNLLKFYWTQSFGLTGVSPVTQWSDALNGQALTPGTAPTLATTWTGSQPTLIFTSASSQFLQSTAAGIKAIAEGIRTPYSVSWQARYTTAVGFTWSWDDGGTTNRHQMRVTNATTFTYVTQISSGTLTVSDITAADYVYTFVDTGTSQVIYQNGVAHNISANINNGTGVTGTTFQLGRGSGGNYTNAKIRRFGMSARALSATDALNLYTLWNAA